MKILVDENIPLITVNSLLGQGHDVWDIRGSESEGMIDDLLWDAAQQEKRLLITTDKGFSQHRMESHYGILIILLKQPNRMKIHQRVMKALNQFSAKDLRDLLLYQLTLEAQKRVASASVSKRELIRRLGTSAISRNRQDFEKVPGLTVEYWD